ncbi:MAG: glycosyltransferase [Kiritimatiellae bacterium]|nr:glycosyltransferase [Kiritimatiellia bacterium]
MGNAATQKRIDESILISVLIPVYNVEKYIRETLASVTSQGLKDIEIIAVDNKSTDGSLGILREIAAKEPRLRVIALPENGGVRASRGAALEAARGRYVYFLDADDLLEPDILAQAFAAAEAGQCDVLQFGHREFRDSDGEVFRTSLPNPKCVGADIRANPAILHLQTKYIWDKLFRHQFLLDNDIHIPVYNYMEDHYFLFSVAMKAKNFGILPVYGYRYRRMVANARTRSYTEELLDCSRAYWDIVQTTREAGLFKELAPSIWRNASECYRWRVLGFANYDDKALQGRIVKDWFDFFQANFPRWQKNLHLAGIPCHLPPGQPKKVLLLGGTGALGAHLRDILAEQGFEVWVTSRSAHADAPHIHYLQLDAMDFGAFKKLTASRWDAIVDFMIYPPKTFEARLDVFLRQTDQYVSLSSARVYADAGMTPLVEDSPRLLDTVGDAEYLKTNEYALAKAREEDILRAKGTAGNWTIIRPYVTFSEERLQLGTLEKEQWLKRALEGRPIVFSRDIAEKLTTLTYGRDVARGMAAVIGRKEACGETFHITSPRQMRWSEVLDLYVKVLADVLGKAPKVVLTRESAQLRTPGRYQVKYDRAFNRRFDNAKIGRFVDVGSFRDPKEALESCLRAFLASSRKFRAVNAQLDELHDLAAMGWPRRLASKIRRRIRALVKRTEKAT